MTMTSTEPVAPDAMSLEAVQAEMRACCQSAVVDLPAYMKRRARLWKRLDELCRPDGGPRQREHRLARISAASQVPPT
jgi:hypothetical protein